MQKAKIEGNKLTLCLYTWEPTTTTADWPWPEPEDYGEGDFFLSVEITAPGELRIDDGYAKVTGPFEAMLDS